MTQLPTRQQVDAAEPLDFARPPRTVTKADQTITVKATIDGFPTEVCFTGSIDQLLQVTRRLRELGAAPTVAQATHTAPLGNGKPKAQTVEPIYQPDGTPCCPVHLRPLQPGQYGLFCSAKAKPGEAASAKGYCSLKFAE